MIFITINCKISSIKIMLSFLGVVVESVLSYPVCLKQVVVVDLSLEAWFLRLMINRLLTLLFILVDCLWKYLQSSNIFLIDIPGWNILWTNSCMPGWIGLKFDIFELMFNEILVMHRRNSQLVYTFYEQAIKLFL